MGTIAQHADAVLDQLRDAAHLAAFRAGVALSRLDAAEDDEPRVDAGLVLSRADERRRHVAVIARARIVLDALARSRLGGVLSGARQTINCETIAEDNR